VAELRRKRSHEHDERCGLKVVDTGVGIPEKSMQLIFELRYSRRYFDDAKIRGNGPGADPSRPGMVDDGEEKLGGANSAGGSPIPLHCRLGIADTKVIEVGATTPPRVLRR